MVPGIDCGADLVGQMCFASSAEHGYVTSESWAHSSPLHSSSLTSPRACFSRRQFTVCSPPAVPRSRDRAADSELTLSSHRKHRRLPRRLRKRCVGSLSRAELSHSCDVPHRGARQAAFGRLWRRRARPRRRERPVPGQGCVPTSRLHQPWPWGGRRGPLGLAVCYIR